MESPPPYTMGKIPAQLAAFQLSVILFGNQCNSTTWKNIRLDRQGAINLIKHLISSDYDVPVLQNLQYITPFLPDPEIESLMLDHRFLQKLSSALVKKEMLGTPSMIRLKGFSNPNLLEELAAIAKPLPDKDLYYIIIKDSHNIVDAPISSCDCDDKKLATIFQRKMSIENDGTIMSGWMATFFRYLDSNTIFYPLAELLVKGTNWMRASRLHYQNCHKDLILFRESMESWLKADLGYVTRPHGILPVEVIKALPSDLLIQMYHHSGLVGYLPNYPDLGKKCLGTILHNVAARRQVAEAVRNATRIKPTPLAEYRKLAGLVKEEHILDLLLLNYGQTPFHINGVFPDFLKSHEYQQLPEDVKIHPDTLKEKVWG